MVHDGKAVVGSADVRVDPETGLRHVEIAAVPPMSRRAMLRVEPDKSRAGQLLARLVAAGSAGLTGDFYDNRDRGHSTLRPARHPGLTVISYDEAAKAAGLDHGLNTGLVFNGITFGNSSTAVASGPRWRSLPRLAMTTPGAMNGVHAVYARNHIYIYPEHRDHDPDRGDVFPAATAQMVISQGSSGSDYRFMVAVANILAALQPETKRFLRDRGLVAPTVQMILRRSMAGIETDADYLSAAAHPSAFAGDRLRRPAAIRLAASLTPETVPPAVSLQVLAESMPAPGIGLLGAGLNEALFETPAAIARLALGTAGLRLYRLRASAPPLAEGQSIRLQWRVLRGENVQIASRTADGSEVDILVPWTEPYAVPGMENLKTHRVDVAVFADNGTHLSAPSFLSVAFPPTERRRYRPDGQPEMIDYAAEPADDGYADPLIFPRRPWRDVFRYDDHGRLLGWTRTFDDGRTEELTRHGYLVVERDPLGRPLRATGLRYPVRWAHGERRVVEPVRSDTRYRYDYADDTDRFGTVGSLQGQAQP